MKNSNIKLVKKYLADRESVSADELKEAFTSSSVVAAYAATTATRRVDVFTAVAAAVGAAYSAKTAEELAIRKVKEYEELTK